MTTAGRRPTSFLALAAAGALVGALGAALVVPPDRIQGDLARLMFVHVPSAWLAYLSFTVTLVASIAYLMRGNLRYDSLAVASGEVGVFFTGLALLTGMIWAKPIWGVWWTWDARLVTTALMFFVYLGYLGLRRGISDQVVRARRSAIFGIIAAAQIPIVHFSVVWWRTLHQPPSLLRPGDSAMDAPFRGGLVASLIAFTLIYAVLVGYRRQLADLEGQAQGV